MDPIFEIFSLAVLKISSSFLITESLLSLRYCISLMFNVCAWMGVEIDFHSSKCRMAYPGTLLSGIQSSLCVPYTSVPHESSL